MSAVYTAETIRQMEQESIRRFVESAGDAFAFFDRLVLDYGCGRQPYRKIVEATGGTYHPYDRAILPANVSEGDYGPAHPLDRSWDAILCTQVVQYEPDVPRLLDSFRRALEREHGDLVLTWPTCWDEVEPEDLHRFTRAGMERMLRGAGLTIVRVERRAELMLGGFRMPLGYGAVARA